MPSLRDGQEPVIAPAVRELAPTTGDVLSPMNPSTLHNADDVSAYATWLFGRSFTPRRGLVHVVSVQAEVDDLQVMRIREGTPRNRHDACMLRIARARADVILTTGKILRDEPELRHELSGSTADGGVLQSWGDRVRGRVTRRKSIVLTGGAGFPADHPLVHGRTDVVVICPRDHANSLRERFLGRAVDVVGLEDPAVGAAVRWAIGEGGAETVLLEAGPATAGPLYGRLDGPNELMLAEFNGVIVPGVRGGRLIDRRTLARLMGPLRYGPPISSREGSWRFAWLERRVVDEA